MQAGNTRLTSADKQQIIDGFLNATGANTFVPAAFVDWLETQPDNPAYHLFYGQSESHQARQWRIHLARRFASGLKVHIEENQVVLRQAARITVDHPEVRPLRQWASDGSGEYTPLDPSDEASMRVRYKSTWISLNAFLTDVNRGLLAMAGADVGAFDAALGLLSQLAEIPDEDAI